MVGVRAVFATALTLLLLTGCAGRESDPTATPGAPTSATTTRPTTTEPTTTGPAGPDGPDADANRTPRRSPSPTRAPRNESRFWVRDRHFYTSPWFAGAHQIMIDFGCTKAPYYDPDPGCPGGRGSHHGIDVAMPCGTKLFAGISGTVVQPDSPGSLGSAYGPHAIRIRIRNAHRDVDVVIGHVRKVYVRPGQRVERAPDRPRERRRSTGRLPPALRDPARGRFGVRGVRPAHAAPAHPHPLTSDRLAR